MAALTEAEKIECRSEMMARLKALARANGWSKAHMLAVFDASDAWVVANQASYVAVLPEPFVSESTASEKALVLTINLAKRYNVGA